MRTRVRETGSEKRSLVYTETGFGSGTSSASFRIQ
jgi:hypothetical protein